MGSLARLDGSPLILVVDDDPAVVYAARALLGRRGCRVEAAFKGLDALARVRAGGVDALLLDVEMPEIDGLSVLAALSDLNERVVRPRVVLMSDSPGAKARAAVERGDALALLRKPIGFAHAHTLITGRVPDQPIEIQPDPARPVFQLVRDILEGRPVQLPLQAPLPVGTPVNLLVPHGPQHMVELLGTATAVRDGQKGLHLSLLPLSANQRSALGEILRGQGASIVYSVKRHAPIAPAENAQAPDEDPADSLKFDRASELYQRGLRRLDQGRYSHALADLSRARGLAEGNLEYQAAEKRAQQLAGALRAQGLAKRARALAITEPREALQLFEEASRLEPLRAAHHLESAELLLQLGDDLEKAEERLGAAIHLAPSDPIPRHHLTKLLERTGRHVEALWASDAALALFPGDSEMRKTSERIRKRLAALTPTELAAQPRVRRA